MTQRPLTAAELADARHAYTRIGKVRWLADTYHLNMLLPQIDDAIRNRTTDGKPLRSERVPTKDDIGKPVKVRTSIETGWVSGWVSGWLFVGFSASGSGNFVAENKLTGQIGTFGDCIIDEEAAQ